MIFPQNDSTISNVKVFINELAPLVCNEYIRRKQNNDKVILPSVCIAQAALESGWNLYAQTLFGIKGDDIVLNTSEYINGEYINLSDSFAKFETVAAAVQGYYDLMQWDNYDDATSKESYQEQLEGLTNDDGYKYATDPNYYSKCISIIESFNLVVFDSYVLDLLCNNDNIDVDKSQDFYTVNGIKIYIDENTNLIKPINYVVSDNNSITDVNGTTCVFWHDVYNVIQYNPDNDTFVLAAEGSIFGRFFTSELVSHGYFEYV